MRAFHRMLSIEKKEDVYENRINVIKMLKVAAKIVLGLE